MQEVLEHTEIAAPKIHPTVAREPLKQEAVSIDLGSTISFDKFLGISLTVLLLGLWITMTLIYAESIIGEVLAASGIIAMVAGLRIASN